MPIQNRADPLLNARPSEVRGPPLIFARPRYSIGVEKREHDKLLLLAVSGGCTPAVAHRDQEACMELSPVR